MCMCCVELQSLYFPSLFLFYATSQSLHDEYANSNWNTIDSQARAAGRPTAAGLHGEITEVN